MKNVPYYWTVILVPFFTLKMRSTTFVPQFCLFLASFMPALRRRKNVDFV